MEATTIALWTFMDEIHVPEDIGPLLTSGETTVAAFRTFKDSAVFTSKRLIVRDSPGKGKRVEIYSLPYSSILMWRSVSGSSVFDSSEEIEIWTPAGHIKIVMGKGADAPRISSLLAWAAFR